MTKVNKQHADWEKFIRIFSQNRMSMFLLAANGSPRFAIKLYVWNAEVSAGIWELISYLEIALRSTIDRQLSAISENGKWLANRKIIPSTSSLQVLINQATNQATVYGRVPSHYQILEQLPLGFLQALLSKKFLHIWPTLASGFKGASRRSHDEISLLVKDLRTLRNKIGHHNHLLDVDVHNAYRKILRLAMLIDPELCDFLEDRLLVSILIDKKPNA